MPFSLIHSFKGVRDRRKRQSEKCLRIKMTLKETNEAKSKGQRNDNEVLHSLKWGDIGAAKSKERCIRRTQCLYEKHLTCRAGRPLGGHHACWSVMCPMETLQTLWKRQGCCGEAVCSRYVVGRGLYKGPSILSAAHSAFQRSQQHTHCIKESSKEPKWARSGAELLFWNRLGARPDVSVPVLICFPSRPGGTEFCPQWAAVTRDCPDSSRGQAKHAVKV